MPRLPSRLPPLKRWCALLALSLLAGCVSKLPPTIPETTELPPEFPWQRYQAAQPGQLYRVDSAASQVTIYVHKAGLLKRLGHNHVMESRGLVGYVLQRAPLDHSFADLYLPLRSLVVDDPEARSTAGKGFESVPSAQDIEATRANMLGSRVLNAAKFPWVHIKVGVPDSARSNVGVLDSANVGVPDSSESATTSQVELDITLRGQSSRHRVEITWWRQGSGVRLTSRFRVTHEQLGLKPFSTLGGALRVADELSFRVVLSLLPTTAMAIPEQSLTTP